jgi:hypothetical protein
VLERTFERLVVSFLDAEPLRRDECGESGENELPSPPPGFAPEAIKPFHPDSLNWLGRPRNSPSDKIKRAADTNRDPDTLRRQGVDIAVDPHHLSAATVRDSDSFGAARDDPLERFGVVTSIRGPF